MSDITKATDDDIKQFLNGKVNESGFLLENAVTKILKKYYTVNREVPYFDKDENKGRAIDLTAENFFLMRVISNQIFYILLLNMG